MIKTRTALPKLLNRLGLRIGAELGVAAGSFSSVLLRGVKFDQFYCIDKWNDHHGDEERLYVLGTLGKLANVSVLHQSFQDAALRFPNSRFDFIYIDGYAHTGQDGGRTLRDWFPKLKSGGLFAGHDYCPKRWPKTFAHVNQFLRDELGYKIHVTGEITDPSWYILKT
jgi:hypothetical protein